MKQTLAVLLPLATAICLALATPDDAEPSEVGFRSESFTKAVKDRGLEQGRSACHGGWIGEQWHERLWHYWYAEAGSGPQSWVLEPMVFDGRGKDAEAWGGVFTCKPDDKRFHKPFACANAIRTGRGARCRAAGFSLCNPFDVPVHVEFKGMLRVATPHKDAEAFVFYRAPGHRAHVLTSTLVPEVLTTQDAGKRRKRTYLKLEAELTLAPSGHLYFVGVALVEELKTIASDFRMIADNDRWGPRFRQHVRMTPVSKTRE